MSSGVEEVDRYSGGLTPTQKSNLDTNITALRTRRQASGGTAPSGMSSPVDIKVTDVIGATKQNPMIAFYAAGIGVMFLLFTASNAGGALLEENESGTLDRILTTRVSLSTLLLGKLAYLWSLGMLQLIIMFIWGAVAFKLDLLGHLPGFAIMAATTALACSAFGLLIASISRTRAQLSAISTLTVLTISAIGGSMFPRFLMPESFQKAGLVLFNSWAIEGFTKVFWREEPLRALWPEVSFLLASALVFFAVARQVTRRWEIA
jgi:ABC-2 type transport system permease protein